MYSKDSHDYFVVDSHIHFWDGTPANQANRYGEGLLNCFYDYHRNLSPRTRCGRWSTSSARPRSR